MPPIQICSEPSAFSTPLPEATYSVRNGLFTVLLGNGNLLPEMAFNSAPYLEIQINSNPPLHEFVPQVVAQTFADRLR